MGPQQPYGMGPLCSVPTVTQTSPWNGTEASPRRPHGVGHRCPQWHPGVPMGWDPEIPSGILMSPWDGPRCPHWHPDVPMGWLQMSMWDGWDRGVTQTSPWDGTQMSTWDGTEVSPRCPHGMDADVPIGTQTSPWDGCRCPHWHPGVPMGWPQMSMWDGWDRDVTQTSPWDGTQMSPLAPRRPHGMAPDVHVGWDRGVTQTSP